jgi:APA family basic amino acid/polyamine antiporter
VDGSLAGLQWRISGLTLVALATIWTVALINCVSVSAGGRTALVVTIAKVALVLAVGIGAFVLAPGSWEHLNGSGLRGTCEGVAASARGGIAGFGAAMLFVNTAYYYTLSPLDIASIPTSSSVATEVLKRFLGPLAVSFTAVAMMISSFGSLHASVLSNSRIPFALARDGLFFNGLAKLSPRSNVPVRALLVQAAWGSLLAVSGTYDTLTDSVIFASWLFYGLSTASLFVFRHTLPDVPRAYRALGYPVVPFMFLLVTAALIVNTFVATPRQALQGVAMLLIGLPFYWYWSRSRRAKDAN